VEPVGCMQVELRTGMITREAIASVDNCFPLIVLLTLVIKHRPTTIFFGPLKHALRGRRFADDDDAGPKLQRVLRDRHRDFHAKVETVC
jgi:hypothetical protein